MTTPPNSIKRDDTMGRAHRQFDEETSRELGELERRLLNDFQRDLPLLPRPYAAIADRLLVDEATVLAALRRLLDEGLVSRVGPVFRPHAVGTSTLAAMAVPPARLDAVAEIINGYAEVNHNYEREHLYNLWFVATAPDAAHLAAVLDDMTARTGLPVMSLPMLEAFHVDLGFSLQWGNRDGGSTAAAGPVQRRRHTGFSLRPGDTLGDVDRRLVAAVQEGFPLVPAPFAVVARRAGLDEATVIARLREWMEDGIVSRVGVVVRHRRLGYRANAMVVWDVPDGDVSSLGHCLGGYDFVTLCYRRPRRLPDWRYNLFCMIHGQDRDNVEQRVEWLVQQCGLEGIPHELLFSRRSFKQCGARYHAADARGTQADAAAADHDRLVLQP